MTPTRGDQLWRSIPAMAVDAAARFGDADAVVDGERRFSFRDLVADARRVSAALIGAGLERGERAAGWSPNRYEWLGAPPGGLRAGRAAWPGHTPAQTGWTRA